MGRSWSSTKNQATSASPWAADRGSHRGQGRADAATMPDIQIGPGPTGRACGLVSSPQLLRRRERDPGQHPQRIRPARQGRHLRRNQARTSARSANYPPRVGRAGAGSTARPGGNAATTAAATGWCRSHSRPRHRHTSGSTGTPAPPPAGGTQRQPGLPPGRPPEGHIVPTARPPQSSACYRA